MDGLTESLGAARRVRCGDTQQPGPRAPGSGSDSPLTRRTPGAVTQPADVYPAAELHAKVTTLPDPDLVGADAIRRMNLNYVRDPADPGEP